MAEIVVYYSLEGSTEIVAKEIAAALNCDLLRIETIKKYASKGFMKFVHGGRDVFMKKKPALKPYEFDASKYDTIIFATPVWASNFVPALKTFIDAHKDALKGKHFNLYTGFLGGGADIAAEKLAEYLEIDGFENHLVLIDPLKKPSDENKEKIEEFCKKIRGVL